MAPTPAATANKRAHARLCTGMPEPLPVEPVADSVSPPEPAGDWEADAPRDRSLFLPPEVIGTLHVGHFGPHRSVVVRMRVKAPACVRIAGGLGRTDGSV